jgi:hypothetical protein
MIGTIGELDVDQKVKEKIFGANAARLLNLA